MAPSKIFSVLFTLILVVTFVNSETAPLHVKAENDRIPGHYIVVLKDDVDVNSFTSSFQAAVLRGASEGKIRHTYEHAIKGFSAQLSENTLQMLRESEHVKFIEEDGIVRAQVSSWGLDRVDQRNLPLDGATRFLGDGSNTHMYVIDTGVLKSHNEFSGRFQENSGFDAFGDAIGKDCNGHGTHCGGTAAGSTYGIATGAKVYSVRVLNCEGSGTFSGVIDGFDWVAENANFPAVASVSLGGGRSDSVTAAVDRLVNNGVVVSVAAGNDNGNACDKSPASAPAAITVGASDKNDRRASFSNYGSCVDIFAPGTEIKSAWIGSDSATKTIQGTSMACPHVSGAAAALLSVDGSKTPAEVTEYLLNSATRDKVSDVQGSPNLMLFIGSDECYADGRAADYRGIVSTTKDGYTCQKWTSQSPHGHSRTPANYPNAGLGDHNYCRNPDNEPGAWCYTTDSNKRWQLCDIGEPSHDCPGECFTDSKDRDYRGKVSSTTGGYKCQKWTSQSPHGHSRTPANYPNAGLGDHNYCRNPDNEPGAWCYTTSSSKRWQFCDVGEPSQSCSNVAARLAPTKRILEKGQEPTMRIPEKALQPTKRILEKALQPTKRILEKAQAPTKRSLEKAQEPTMRIPERAQEPTMRIPEKREMNSE